MAATWDTDRVRAMGDTISAEARAKYNTAQRQGNHSIFKGLTFWSPNINIFRDPRWGRGQETYGEDPFLTAQYGVAFITGLQGEDPDHPRTIATPKHYAVHSGPEPTRHAMDVPDQQARPDRHLYPAFRAAIVDAKAGSLMCAYNRVNGQPACASDFPADRSAAQRLEFQRLCHVRLRRDQGHLCRPSLRAEPGGGGGGYR